MICKKTKTGKFILFHEIWFLVYLFIFIYSSRTRWLWVVTNDCNLSGLFSSETGPSKHFVVVWRPLRSPLSSDRFIILNVNRYCIYAACLIMPAEALIPSLNSVNNNIHSSRVTYNCWCLTKSFDIVVERLSTSYNGVILVVPD